MEKQKILYQQARLHARGAAEMVLQMISSSKGERSVKLWTGVPVSAHRQEGETLKRVTRPTTLNHIKVFK